ncbi:helix-turn-helix domain-containing protein [Nocardiopsis sp. NPDC006139]|uniref:helix-turn-helix transcriptional regulator n=1 Tax=Nocardiopsis sp. NPDC006139 TaxID=3154578 RepID=UPI0033A59D6D
MIPGYLTIAAVAERIGVSPKTVRQYQWRGDMPPPDERVGQSPLWKETTIEQWEKDRASASWNRKK